MATATMMFSVRYSTHLPVLMQAVSKTSGDVLELGAGLFSTPVLHWLVAAKGRKLISLDNDPKFYDWAKPLADKYHRIACVESWDDAWIDRPWDVVLVDHSPDERRIVEIQRLKDFAKYLIIHDSNGRYEKNYHYSRIYPLFKYHLDFNGAEPSTTVLSNLVSLKDFWK
jgi:hypothetical protein